MPLEFSAIVERGEKYYIASCPELPEANGQGSTRDQALQDLAVSIQSVLDFRRQEAFAQAAAGAEKTFVVVA